ncbi:hypothetical protein ACLKA6_006488 [Drosophila palustris]
MGCPRSIDLTEVCLDYHFISTWRQTRRITELNLKSGFWFRFRTWLGCLLLGPQESLWDKLYEFKDLGGH